MNCITIQRSIDFNSPDDFSRIQNCPENDHVQQLCVCVLLIDNWNFLFSLYNSVSSVSVFLHLFVCVCVLKRYAKLFNFLYIRKYKRYLIYWFSFSLSGIQKVFFRIFKWIEIGIENEKIFSGYHQAFSFPVFCVFVCVYAMEMKWNH